MKTWCRCLCLLALVPAQLIAQQPRDTSGTARSERPRSQCATAAVVLGGGTGLLAGALIGMGFQQVFFPGSGGDDPGLTGLVIGSAAGAIGGVAVGRHFCHGSNDQQFRSEIRRQLMRYRQDGRANRLSPARADRENPLLPVRSGAATSLPADVSGH